MHHPAIIRSTIYGLQTLSKFTCFSWTCHLVLKEGAADERLKAQAMAEFQRFRQFPSKLLVVHVDGSILCMRVGLNNLSQKAREIHKRTDCCNLNHNLGTCITAVYRQSSCNYLSDDSDDLKDVMAVTWNTQSSCSTLAN